MKRIIRIAVLTILCTAVAAFAQAKKELTPKDTPASQSLIRINKEKAQAESQASAKQHAAIAELNKNNKVLIQQMQDLQKEIQDKLKKDKHYKSLLTKIEAIQKQLNEAGKKAQTSYMEEVGPLQGKVQSDTEQIKALIPIVRKENGFSGMVIFNETTGKWEELGK